MTDLPIQGVGALVFSSPKVGWLGNGAVSDNNRTALYKWNGGNLLSSTSSLQTEEIALKISPNPTSRYLTASYYATDFKPTDLAIYDVIGKLVLSKKVLSSNSQTIDLEQFTNGVYVLQLKNTEGVVAAQKFVVEH